MRRASAFAAIALSLSASAQTDRGNPRFGPAPRADGTLDLAMLWSQVRAMGSTSSRRAR